MSAILTMYYSIRLIYSVFVDNFNGFKLTIKNHVKITNIELFILGFLVISSITTGYLFKDLFIGIGSNYFNNTIFILPITGSFIDLEFIPSIIKLMPVITSNISLILALLLNKQTHFKQNQALIDINNTYLESCK